MTRKVPDVKGEKLCEAKTAIKTGKCAVGEVTKVRLREVAKNVVISTAQKAGKILKLKTKVTSKVSSGNR